MTEQVNFENPLVSIITPAYNAEAYIADTIRSVQNQEFKNWEMLIVDDGSTDGTAHVVNQFAVEDSRIRFFYQENGRQGKARNHAITQSKGEYLAFLDADDLWEMEKLKLQLQTIEAQKADLVYSSGISFQNDIVTVIEVRTGIQNDGILWRDLLNGFSIPVLSVLVRKLVVTQAGGFSENPRVQNAEDYELWLKLMDNGVVFYGMEKKLFRYRIHENQVTNNDGNATIPAIFALAEVKLKSLQTREKNAIMIRRINRAVLHNLDIADDLTLRKYISLFLNPLGQSGRYLLHLLVYNLGKGIYKRWGYRFLDLNLLD